MAVAATLAVLVKAEGIGNLSRQLSGVHGDLTTTAAGSRKAGDELEKTGKRGSRALGGLKNVAAGLGGLVAFSAVSKGVHMMVDEFQEARKVGAQTDAVLKSTGGAANVTRKQIETLATSLSKKAGVDDEAIQSGQNLILTFSKVRNETGRGNDVFNRATRSALDMSAALGVSMPSASKQLGKALQDPVAGIGKLARSGVTFTAQQKEQIETLVKSGKTLEAQKIIIGEVDKKFGGSAAATATPMDKLKVSVANLAETGGSILVPALDKGVKVLAAIADASTDVIEMFEKHKTIATILGGAVAALVVGWGAYAAITKTVAVAQALLNVVMTANPILLVVVAVAALAAGMIYAYKHSETFREIVDGAFRAVGDAATWLVGAVVTAFNGIKDAVTGAAGVIGGVVDTAIGFIKDAAGKLGDAGRWILERIVSGVVAVAGGIKDAALWIRDRIVGFIHAEIAGLKTAGSWILNRIVDGFKAVTGLLSSVGGWIKNRITDFVQAEITGLKIVGGWILNRIVDGFKVVTGLLSSVGGWVKNRVVDFVHAEVDGFKIIGGWILNRITDGIKVVSDALSGIGGWLKNRLKESFDAVKDGFTGLGGTIIGWIVAGLKGGMKLLGGFLNKVIDVVNILPGVSIKHIDVDKLAKGGTFQAFAGGGAFARTGGLVSSPITLMGEEAPRHPEYVIPTNPAYRDRARGLLAGAAGAIGMAGGGRFMSTSYGPPWTGINGTGVTADGTDLRPAKHAFGVAVDPSVIALGSMLSVQPNPFNRAGKFKAFDTGSAIKGNRLDFYDWRGRDSQYGWGTRSVNVSNVSKGGGILNTIGNAIGAVGGVLGDLMEKGADFILDKLPGVGSLPDWLQGLGRNVLGNVTDWVKNKVSGILDGAMVGGDGGMKATGGKLQLPTTFTSTHPTGGLAGYPAIDVFASPGTKVLSPADGVIGRLGGKSPSAGAYQGAGGPFGWSMYLNSGRGTYFLTHFGARSVGTGDKVRYGQMLGLVGDYPGGVPDHIHEGFTGLARGGLFGGGPFVGSYASGGVVPRDGLAYVHQGETVTPAGRGDGPLVNIERMDIHEHVDWVREWRNVERQLSVYGGA